MKRVAITSPSNVRTAPSIALNILGAFARSSISVLLWVSARFLGVLHNGSTFGECGSAGFGAVFFSSTLATHLLAGLIPQLSPSPSLAGGAVRLGVLRMASGFSSDGEPSLSRAGLLLPRGAGIGFPSPSSPLFSATFCLSQACLNGGGIRVWL
mmetsp:Transcript_500/g.791  ORF Transcript_500/g.791 Transcript_500/m.791 type:complete len:154 (-) Transcript_500:91-552(-)